MYFLVGFIIHNSPCLKYFSRRQLDLFLKMFLLSTSTVGVAGGGLVFIQILQVTEVAVPHTAAVLKTRWT